MRFFVDMDGTLAKWNNVEFEQLFEKGYYRNLEPNKDIIQEVKALINQGEDIYILSCVLPESKYALDEKKEWLRDHLPELSEDKYIFVPYGQNKADYLKEHYSPITSKDYLIDDYTKNLQEWKEYGGTGVKYLNGINHTRGTWQGLVVYAQKSSTIPVVDENKNLINLIDSEKLKKLNNMKSLNKIEKLNSINGEISISRKEIKDIAEKIGEQKSKQKLHQKVLKYNFFPTGDKVYI